jgi:hypothetical protein
MSTVPVRRIVNVTMQVAALAPAAPTFSKLVCIGSSARLPTYDRLRTYGPTEYADDFQATDEEYKFAQRYFAQSPQPKELMIGRRLLAAFAGTLKSGLRSATLTDYTAVTAGGFDITINGTAYKVHSIDLHACTDMAGVATAVQTRLAAALASTTCVDTGSAFLVTSPTTGTASTVGYASAPTTADTTDLSGILGLTALKSAIRQTGGVAEDLAAAAAAFAALDGSWYGCHATKDADIDDDDRLAASLWAEANNKFHFITYSNPVAYDGTSQADLGYRLKAAQYTHTLIQFSSTDDYAAVSAAARGLAVKYSQINSTITLEFKQEPGVVPEDLSSTQRTALEAKNYCYLATVANGFICLFNTKTPSGRFFDEIVNLDWFQADLANNVFTALATSPTKVPQTDKGMTVLLQAAAKTCDQAARNGLAAPGVWTHDEFGALKTGDFLQQAYYLYAGPVSAQSDADRASRVTPPIQGALIGAGALHSVDITFNFQR